MFENRNLAKIENQKIREQIVINKRCTAPPFVKLGLSWYDK